MQAFNTKTANNGTTPDGQLTAAEFNQIADELESVITRSGQAPSAEKLVQLARAMSITALGAHAMQDGGVANAYVLTPITGSNGLVLPEDYTTMNGAQIAFVPGNTNTGPCTVNLGQSVGSLLGTKKLLTPRGAELRAGDLAAGVRVECRYDPTADAGAGAWILSPASFLERGAGAVITASRVLTADDAGLVRVDATAGPVTLTLPAANTLAGLRYRIVRVDTTGNAVTVQRTGTDVIDGASTSLAVTYRSAALSIESDGLGWWTTGNMPSMSPANPGWMRVPGGLILQWGSAITSSSGIASVTFPVTFPNACLQTYASDTAGLAGLGGNDFASASIELLATGMNIYSANVNGVASATQVRWLAIGY